MGVSRDHILPLLPNGLPVARERCSGWGRFAHVDCVVARPRQLDELQALLRACAIHGISITPKGSGCSFGDLVTNREGIVLDTSGWNEIIRFDPDRGLLTAQCGASAGRVLHRILPHHWVVRGLPGTSFGTMAGFAANNVHGKDSFRHGNFGEGVVAMRMLLGDGRVIAASREENAEIFHAAIGGMGLTGIILEVTLQLIRIPGSLVATERHFFSSIPELFDRFGAIPDTVDMDMAWFDGFDRKGRGIFQTATWLNRDPAVQPPSMESIGKKFMGRIPIGLVYPLVKPFACRTAMRALNILAWRGAKVGKAGKELHLYHYYYPHMIAIPDSPKAIRGGLVGFQCIAPVARARAFIEQLLALGRRHKLESWFGGIKRLKKDPFPMSFSDDGYAITIELPGRYVHRPAFPAFLEALVALTIDHQGKIFLGKDALLRPAHVRAMYPRLPEFQRVRTACDPQGVFASDLSRRLEL